MSNDKLKVNTNIQIQSWEVDVPSTTTVGEETYKTITFPIDINLIRGSFFNKPDFLGDFAAMTVAENTVIGAVIANASIDDEWLDVSSTVIDNIERGYYVTINGVDLDRCLEVDYKNNKIKVAPLSEAIAAGSYVLITIQFVPHIYLEGTNTKEILEGGVDPSFIKAGTPIKITYTNNNLSAKTFSLRFEYHY